MMRRTLIFGILLLAGRVRGRCELHVRRRGWSCTAVQLVCIYRFALSASLLRSLLSFCWLFSTQVVPPAWRKELGVECHYRVARVPRAAADRVQHRQHHRVASGRQAFSANRTCTCPQPTVPVHSPVGCLAFPLNSRTPRGTLAPAPLPPLARLRTDLFRMRRGILADLSTPVYSELRFGKSRTKVLPMYLVIISNSFFSHGPACVQGA